MFPACQTNTNIKGSISLLTNHRHRHKKFSFLLHGSEVGLSPFGMAPLVDVLYQQDKCGAFSGMRINRRN
jgi:hypothetical protein